MNGSVDRPLSPSALRRRAPRATLWRILRHVVPAWHAGGLAFLGAGVFTFGALVALGSFAIIVNEKGENSPLIGLLLLAMIVVPLSAALFIMAGLLPSRTGGRGLIWLTTGGVLCVGVGSCAECVGQVASRGAAYAWALTSYGSFAAVALVGGAAFLLYTPVAISNEVSEERHERARAVVESLGSLGFEELASATGLTPAGARAVVIDLIADGKLKARLEDRFGRVQTAEYVARTQRELVERVRACGRATLAELAAPSGERPELIAEWLEELRAARALSLVIDRGGAEVVFDPLGPDEEASAGALRRGCTECGGMLRAVGGALFRCVYCGAEEEAQG